MRERFSTQENDHNEQDDLLFIDFQVILTLAYMNQPYNFTLGATSTLQWVLFSFQWSKLSS